VLRSRIAAAAVGATVLGITAALVPTVSNAADPAVATATPVVQWADSADDFTAVPVSESDVPLSDGWNFLVGYNGEDPATTSITDVATFDSNGIAAKPDQFVPLLHALPSAVSPDDVPALVSTASANVGTGSQVGLTVGDAATPSITDGTVFATNGFTGDTTTWDGSESTTDLVTDLKADDKVVTGYFVTLGSIQLQQQQQQQQRSIPNAPQGLFANPTAATSRVAAVAAAVTPVAGGAASIAVGDTTTYFTPQPTAAATVGAASYTVTQATTSGVQVTGSGFAPNEVISFGLSLDGNGGELEGLTLVADADGNVSGTIVLPASFVPGPGTYSLAVVGNSSGQSLFTPLVITADPAPVATPISGRATFTG